MILSPIRQLALVLLACGCAEAAPRTPVILISIDTLRADHLTCYQSRGQPTPHMDQLAENGTLFSQVSSLVPLTLPSHVALFTSLYPFMAGVEDNAVPFTQGETIATVLKDAGYRTAAFVGGFVLDRRFGLSAGFDVYDSPFDLHKKTTTDAGDLKRPGAQVAGAAERWLDQSGDTPFFLFLHLYDLHTPYDLPDKPRLRHGETGYGAELAYVDGVIGNFLASLERHGILNTALILLTSDHGEGLGDHGESTHGYFIYQTTLRVPLIIHWPKGQRRLKQDRIDDPASLLDIAPTILDSLGLPKPNRMRGRSLLVDKADAAIYSESIYARNHFGCAALRCLRNGRYKYIDAPTPELYDLAADPLESRNLNNAEQPRARAMRQRLMALISAPPAARPQSPSPEAMSALRSLGYLSGSTASSRLASHIDPKDRLADFELYGQALALASAGRLDDSSALLSRLAGKLPEVADIRVSLGLNYQKIGRHSEAVREFQQVVGHAPLNAQAHFDLGLSQFRLQHSADAIHELQAALAIEPWYTRAEELLADIYLQVKDYAKGRERLDHLLLVDPENYTAHYNLGVLAARNGNWGEAQQQLVSALHTDPESAEAHNTLGGVYLQQGDLDQARREIEHAIRLTPGSASAHYNLALVSEKQQRMDEVAAELREALKADPDFKPARLELERVERSTSREH